MRYYQASSMIAASPEAVRAVLADGAARSWRDPGAGGADGQMPLGLFRGIKRRVETGR
jgi:hypothetical protein